MRGARPRARGVSCSAPRIRTSSGSPNSSRARLSAWLSRGLAAPDARRRARDAGLGQDRVERDEHVQIDRRQVHGRSIAPAAIHPTNITDSTESIGNRRRPRGCFPPTTGGQPMQPHSLSSDVTIHTHACGEGGIFVNAYLVETRAGVVAIDATLTETESKQLRAEVDAARQTAAGRAGHASPPRPRRRDHQPGRRRRGADRRDAAGARPHAQAGGAEAPAVDAGVRGGVGPALDLPEHRRSLRAAADVRRRDVFRPRPRPGRRLRGELGVVHRGRRRARSGPPSWAIWCSTERTPTSPTATCWPGWATSRASSACATACRWSSRGTAPRARRNRCSRASATTCWRSRRTCRSWPRVGPRSRTPPASSSRTA